MARLEELVRRIESNETGIDQLAGELKEAQRLVAFCREKLYVTDEEIKKILETGEKRSLRRFRFRPVYGVFLVK